MTHCFEMELFFILAYLASISHAVFFSKFVKLANTDVKFNTEIASFFNRTIGTCSLKCAHSSECDFTSYHSGLKLCNLHAGNGTLTSSPGWELFSKSVDATGSTQTDPMVGATASQSATFAGLHADLALDGITEGALSSGSCAHTTNGPNTYWMMQLASPAVIAKIELYLRSDFWMRNTNRAVSVAQSYEDAISNVGIECGRYDGPVISSPPFMLSFRCPLPIYGRYVRVTMLSDDYMEICEVSVFTP